MRKSRWKRLTVILAVLLLGAGTVAYVAGRVPAEESGMTGEADKGITEQADVEGQEPEADRTADESETGDGLETSGGAQSGSDEEPLRRFMSQYWATALRKDTPGTKRSRSNATEALPLRRSQAKRGYRIVTRTLRRTAWILQG